MEENIEKNRMKELANSFKEAGEVYKSEREETNSEKISEEYKRLSELATGEKTGATKEAREHIKEAQQGGFMGGNEKSGGFHGTNQPRSVTSIIDNLYDNPTKYQGAQGNGIRLKDNEALDVAVKRTLKSGAPVNDIAFYDEVNWHLMNLGFPSKLPQDIKEFILKLITG